MNVWAVGLFGMAGACLRYMTGIWLHGRWATLFPLGTLTVNLAGCLALGWFAAWAASRPAFPAWLRTGIATGLIGSFTTFSTFSVETVELARGGHLGLAGLYLLLSVIGGLAFAGGGLAVHQWQRSRRSEEGPA